MRFSLDAWRTAQALKSNRIMIYQAVASAIRGGGVAPQETAAELAAFSEMRGEGRIAQAYRDLSLSLSVGDTLAEGFEPIATCEDKMLLATSQTTADIPALLTTVAGQAKFRRAILKAAIAPLVYPLILLMGFIVAYVALGSTVLPTLMSVLPVNRRPLISIVQQSLSEFIGNWMIVAVALAIMAVVALIWALPNWTGKVREKVDQWPLFTTYRVLSAGNFIYGLAYLLANRVDFIGALDRLRDYSNPYMTWRISQMMYQHEHAEDDDPVAALDVGLLPTAVVDMLRIIAKREGIEKALHMVAVEQSAELLEHVNVSTRTSVIFLWLGVLLIAVGLLLGTFGLFPYLMDAMFSGNRGI